jgi:hypothetical protein
MSSAVLEQEAPKLLRNQGVGILFSLNRGETLPYDSTGIFRFHCLYAMNARPCENKTGWTPTP